MENEQLITVEKGASQSGFDVLDDFFLHTLSASWSQDVGRAHTSNSSLVLKPVADWIVLAVPNGTSVYQHTNFLQASLMCSGMLLSTALISLGPKPVAAPDVSWLFSALAMHLHQGTCSLVLRSGEARADRTLQGVDWSMGAHLTLTGSFVNGCGSHGGG